MKDELAKYKARKNYSPVFSRKHFELIANIFADYIKDGSTKEEIIEQFADVFEDLNTNFNRNLFMKRCVGDG